MRLCFAPGTLPPQPRLVVGLAELTRSTPRIVGADDWARLTSGGEEEVHDALHCALGKLTTARPADGSPCAASVLRTRARRLEWEDAFRARIQTPAPGAPAAPAAPAAACSCSPARGPQANFRVSSYSRVWVLEHGGAGVIPWHVLRRKRRLLRTFFLCRKGTCVHQRAARMQAAGIWLRWGSFSWRFLSRA
jgi:hypothetical protein